MSDRQDQNRSLRAVPFQVVPVDDGVILKRGAAELYVSGPGSREVMATVVGELQGAGATRGRILESFPRAFESQIAQLLDMLLSRGFAVAVDSGHSPSDEIESRVDVFFWQHGTSEAAAKGKASSTTVLLAGINSLSEAIARKLQRERLGRVHVGDYLFLRALSFFDENGSLRRDLWSESLPQPLPIERLLNESLGLSDTVLVAATDFGGAHYLRDLNRAAVEQGWRFLGVVLDGYSATIGPLVVPGEGPCFECVRARENANVEHPQLFRASEAVAFEGQSVHPLFVPHVEIVAEYVLLELHCGLTNVPPRLNPPSLLEFDFRNNVITRRRVLRLPRCLVCSGYKRVPTLKIHK